eukprot:5973_1
MNETVIQLRSSWIIQLIALIMYALGATIDGIAWIIQKVGQQQSKSNLKSYTKSSLWWKGYLLHSFSTVFCDIMLGFGPQSLLLPLKSLTSVTQVIGGNIYLKEPLLNSDIFAIILIIFGCIIAILYGPRSVLHEKETINALLLRYTKPSFVIFVTILTLIIFIIYLFTKCMNSKSKSVWLMISYCVISAYFASWNVSFVKCLTEIIANGLFNSFVTLIVILCVALTAVLIEHWRQRALRNFDAGMTGAIIQMLIIIGGSSFGGIYFEEFHNMTYTNMYLFVSAIAISLIGILIIGFKDFHQKIKII